MLMLLLMLVVVVETRSDEWAGDAGTWHANPVSEARSSEMAAAFGHTISKFLSAGSLPGIRRGDPMLAVVRPHLPPRQAVGKTVAPIG